MKKILWLPGWYPNRMDKFDGDFIQRHARAVSGFCNIHLVYVVKKDGSNSSTEVTVDRSPNLTEQIIYYKPVRTGIRSLDRFLSHWKYLSLHRKAIKEYIRKEGEPHCVHVHVALKTGLVAQWIKLKWNIPFIITEHWTGYLPEADDRLEYRSAIQLRQLVSSFREASAVTVVSDHLGKAIQKHFSFVEYKVIPNVVDVSVFYPTSSKPTDPLRLIHVSNMTYQKNPEAIMQALAILKRSGIPFQLECYGVIKPEIVSLTATLGLNEQVIFKGEVTQPILAEAMRNAHALILYSRFETFGCVIIEANACGVPVILSDIAAFHELVSAGTNGIFVKADDPIALADAFIAFEKNRNQFDGEQIARLAKASYSYQVVGEQFYSLYS